MAGAPPRGLALWWMAARPATLWVAVAPVVVGSALAVEAGAFRWDALVVTLIASVAIQVGVNFANDVSDAVRGADTAERIGPARVVAAGLVAPRTMWTAIGVVFGVATIAGAYLVWLGGWPILVVGVASMLAALAYTGGPFPYGYRGLGEVFVFAFFGVVATVGTRYVFDRSAPAAAWILAVPMGLLAAAILIANNYRDIDTDRAVGKRTLAVIMGRRATKWLFAVSVLAPFLVFAVGSTAGPVPAGAALGVLAAPLAVPLVRTLWTETTGPALVGVLKGTARLQAASAALVAGGIIWL